MRNRNSIIFFFSILIIGSCFGFDSDKTPGTPELIIDSEISVNNVYIDVFVLDTLLQVVFMASVSPLPGDSILEFLPGRSLDTISIYTISHGRTEENCYVATKDSPARIAVFDSTLTIRITFETGIIGHLPGSSDRIFGLFPPFVTSENKILPARELRTRFMLPPEFTPTDCPGSFRIAGEFNDHLVWEFIESGITRPCHFRAVGNADG